MQIKIAANWKTLSAEEKKEFEEEAAKDKERFANEMKTYVPTPGYEKTNEGKKKGAAGEAKTRKTR